MSAVPSAVRQQAVDEAADGHAWRKYGQKYNKHSTHPTCYYRCATQHCPCKRQVSHDENGQATVVYRGEHNHARPFYIKLMVGSPEQFRLCARRYARFICDGQECDGDKQPAINDPLVVQQSRDHGVPPPDPQEVDALLDRIGRPPLGGYEHKCGDRRIKISFSIDSGSLAEPNEPSAVTLGSLQSPGHNGAIADYSDGFAWRKYGQKHVRGSGVLKAYYRCANSDCNARKTVQRPANTTVRSLDIVVSYEGSHSHCSTSEAMVGLRTDGDTTSGSAMPYPAIPALPSSTYHHTPAAAGSVEPVPTTGSILGRNLQPPPLGDRTQGFLHPLLPAHTETVQGDIATDATAMNVMSTPGASISIAARDAFSPPAKGSEPFVLTDVGAIAAARALNLPFPRVSLASLLNTADDASSSASPPRRPPSPERRERPRTRSRGQTGHAIPQRFVQRWQDEQYRHAKPPASRNMAPPGASDIPPIMRMTEGHL